MNNQTIDQALDDVQKIFKEIKITHDLSHATVERWRWDVPQISLRWKGIDAICRSITVLIDTIQTTETRLISRIGVNAWLDQQKDNRWVRRWKYSLMGQTNPLADYILLRSYDTVAKWTLDELTSQQPLPEATSAFLDQQRG